MAFNGTQLDHSSNGASCAPDRISINGKWTYNVLHPISDACWWVITSSSATTIPMINYAQGLLPPSETFDLSKEFFSNYRVADPGGSFCSTITDVNTRFCVSVTKLLCALVFHLIMWRDEMWNDKNSTCDELSYVELRWLGIWVEWTRLQGYKV